MSTNNKNKNTKNTPPTLGKAEEESLLGLNQQKEAVVNTNLRPFTAGIFLDNDIWNRESVINACKGKMRVPFINETYKFKGVRFDDEDYAEMLQQLSDNGAAAANLMIQLRSFYSNGTEAYDRISGINETTKEKIFKWVEENEKVKSVNVSGAVGAGAGAAVGAITKPNLVAIFDFDRTITVMEGGYFWGNSVEAIKEHINGLVLHDEGLKSDPGLVDDIKKFVPGLTVEGFAEYLAGGELRMTMLQEMFDHLYRHNVTIVVLTNNEVCSERRGFFQEMMMVYTRGRPVEIICGMDFRYNKGRAILGTTKSTGILKSLRDMCMKSNKSGGKRTMTMKAKTRKQIRINIRRQTKKH